MPFPGPSYDAAKYIICCFPDFTPFFGKMMIHAQLLKKQYTKGQHTVIALNEIDLTIEKGQQLAMIGQSGSGKSTFLNLLAGLDRPSSGELLVHGKQLHKFSSKQIADYRLKTVGVVFQSFQLIAQRNVYQNIELPLLLSGVGGKERRLRTQEALEDVSMKHRANHFPFELSGGEQQRVAIARAIVTRPKILLADEPTGNLDPHNRHEIQALMSRLCRMDNRTFVLVTHDHQLADQMCQQIVQMKDGQIESQKEMNVGE